MDSNQQWGHTQGIFLLIRDEIVMKHILDDTFRFINFLNNALSL